MSEIKSKFTREAETSPPSNETKEVDTPLGSPNSPGTSASFVENPAREEVEHSLTVAMEQLEVEKEQLPKFSWKQYKMFLTQGMDPSVAREKAAVKPKQGLSKTPASTKGQHSDNSTPEGAPKDQKSEASEAFGSVSRRNAVFSTRVGVMAADFPDTLLTVAQLEKVQEAFIAKIIELPKEGICPAYLSCRLEQGYMVLTCANETTAQWSLKVGKELKPWDGANLTAVEEKDIPRPLIISAFLPHSKERSSEDILSLISEQNVGLFVKNWWIINRTNAGEDVHLVISVDSVSAEKLKKYGSKVHYLFGQVHVRLGY